SSYQQTISSGSLYFFIPPGNMLSRLRIFFNELFLHALAYDNHTGGLIFTKITDICLNLKIILKILKILQ
ncbi:MAG: hypothetical protein ABI813_05480, partial [Bacteroidota bacterium]